jgi:hypothetical protein
MTVEKYTLTSDAGHGWLTVPRKRLNQLGILGQVSRYSYQSGDGEVVYLEEDCDLMAFIHALKTVGIQPCFNEVYEEPCGIRNRDHFTLREGEN